MNKHDRAKLKERLDDYVFPETWSDLIHIVTMEVDRAIRAERRAQKLADEEANKWREEAQQRARDEVIGRFGVKL